MERISELQSTPARIRRLIFLTAAGVGGAFLVIQLALAWNYVGSLTAPACLSPPPLPGDLPKPNKIWIEAADGGRVPAWFFPGVRSAAVITMGGIEGALGNRLPPAAPLIRSGFTVLQLGSRACGDPVLPVTLGFDEARDTEAGLDFLLGRPEVDRQRIGVFGFSMGGVAAIRSAARRPEISAVVAEGGYFNLGRDMVEADHSQPLPVQALLYSVAGIFWLRTGVNPWSSSPIDDLPLISPRPLLLIYGKFELDDGRALQQYEAASEPKQLWIVPGAGHGQSYSLNTEAYEQRVLDFFISALEQ